MRNKPITFEGPPKAPEPVPRTWRFGQKGVNCNYLERNTNLDVVPMWPLYGQARNCNRGPRAPKSGVLTKHLRAPEATLIGNNKRCDGLFGNWRGNKAGFTCSKVDQNAGIRVRNANSVDVDVTLHDCIEMVKADDRCSDVFFLRSEAPSDNQTMCW